MALYKWRFFTGQFENLHFPQTNNASTSFFSHFYSINFIYTAYFAWNYFIFTSYMKYFRLWSFSIVTGVDITCNFSGCCVSISISRTEKYKLVYGPGPALRHAAAAPFPFPAAALPILPWLQLLPPALRHDVTQVSVKSKNCPRSVNYFISVRAASVATCEHQHHNIN